MDFCFVRTTIREPIAFDALQRLGSAIRIRNTQRRAIAVTDIELRRMATPVVRTAMLAGRP
jgi:hypothetical protein